VYLPSASLVQMHDAHDAKMPKHTRHIRIRFHTRPYASIRIRDKYAAVIVLFFGLTFFAIYLKFTILKLSKYLLETTDHLTYYKV
jgi:hypothetical protein